MRITIFLVSLFSIGVALAQEDRLTNLAIVPLAYRPVEIQDSSGRLLQEPRIEEYVRMNRYEYSLGSRPQKMDIVVVIENISGEQVENLSIVLQMSRRITELRNGANPEALGEWSIWQEVDHKEMDILAADRAIKVMFENLSIKDLWYDLWQTELWPSEIQFRVTMICSQCEDRVGKEATIRFIAGD